MKKFIFLLFIFTQIYLRAGVINDLTSKRIVGSASIKDNVVYCAVPESKAKGIHGAVFDIDLKPYRNCNVIFQVEAKAKNLSKPPKRYLGHKFMLIYKTSDGKKHYAENNGKYGSFNKLLRFKHTIDGNADHGEIRFCIQDVSGKMQYHLSTFKIIKKSCKKNVDYICEYSDSVKNRAVHRGVMSPIRHQDDEENFKVLRKWNVNLMRLQLNTSDEWARNNPERYRKFIAKKIEKIIPAVLDLGKKYGIKIIIDLHTVPGSAAMTKNSTGIYNNEKAVKEFISIWKRIASKFKGHPALYGYDLINEPKQNRKTKYDYWELQKMAAEAIRKIDPETPIYVTSNMRSSQYAFSYLSPIKLKNIIYEVHCYEPFIYTHKKYTQNDRESGKKLAAYPGCFYGTKWDRESLCKRLKQVKKFQTRHKAKIFVGEFSTRAYSPGGDVFLRDYISIFEKFGWDWTYHAFREAKIWNVEYKGPDENNLKFTNNTLRKKVLLNAFRKNKEQ